MDIYKQTDILTKHLTSLNGTPKRKLLRTLDGTLSKDLTTGQLCIKEARWDPKKESIKYARWNSIKTYDDLKLDF